MSICGYSTIAIDKGTEAPLLKKNISSIIGRGSVEVMELDWYEASAAADILARLNGQIPDLVICSDCVYQHTTVTPLMKLLNTVG